MNAVIQDKVKITFTYDKWNGVITYKVHASVYCTRMRTGVRNTDTFEASDGIWDGLFDGVMCSRAGVEAFIDSGETTTEREYTFDELYASGLYDPCEMFYEEIPNLLEAK